MTSTTGCTDDAVQPEPPSEPPAALHARAATDGAIFRQLVADGYDQCADAYLAQHARGDPNEMRMKAWAPVAATLPERAHVLDVGCGAGVPVASSIVEHERQLRVTGIDISPRQIELAKQLVVSPRATFLCGDMSGLAFEGGSFDAVCAFFSVFHLPRRDHGNFFRRVATWLKPGGTFVFNLGSGAGDGEGEASVETGFLGATTMLWSSHPRDVTVELLRSAGLELVGVSHPAQLTDTPPARN